MEGKLEKKDKKAKRGLAPPQLKSRAWIFTIFEDALVNFVCSHEFGSQAHADALFGNLLKAPSRVKRMVVGLETCPETKRLHYQGYLNADYAIMGSALQTCWLLAPKCHIDVAKGSPADNKRYCLKEGNQRICVGTFPEKAQGQRSDLSEVCEAIEQGSSMRELATVFPEVLIKYPSGIKLVHGLRAVERSEMTKLFIYWGETHTGKSHLARRVNGAVAVKMVNGFWHGVDNSLTPVCIEEFTWLDYPLTQMLALIDAYPVDLNVKNGSVSFRASAVYLTSNTDPATWYATAPREQKEAWDRRVTEIKHFTEKYVQPPVADRSPGHSTPPLVRSAALLTPPPAPSKRGVKRALTFVEDQLSRDDWEVEDITDTEPDDPPSPPSRTASEDDEFIRQHEEDLERMQEEEFLEGNDQSSL